MQFYRGITPGIKSAIEAKTSKGVAFLALSDEDMLKCQTALPEKDQKLDRIRFLKQILQLP